MTTPTSPINLNTAARKELIEFLKANNAYAGHSRDGLEALRTHALATARVIDATVAAVVLVWPVIDPLRRFQHAKRLQAAGGTYPEQIDRVIPLHLKFWQTEEAMEEGNPVGILERGETVEMPPVLYVQGGKDVVHPRADLERFVASYRRRGGAVDLALYEGEGEGFIRNPASAAAPQALARIISFVHKQLS